MYDANRGHTRQLTHCAWGGRLCLHPFTERLVAVRMHGNQAFGRKESKLGGGSLLMIFPSSPKRVITLLPLSQRDRGEYFQIWDFVFAR